VRGGLRSGGQLSPRIAAPPKRACGLPTTPRRSSLQPALCGVKVLSPSPISRAGFHGPMVLTSNLLLSIDFAGRLLRSSGGAYTSACGPLWGAW
jgi:hypothetical protein